MKNPAIMRCIEVSIPIFIRISLPPECSDISQVSPSSLISAPSRKPLTDPFLSLSIAIIS